MTCHRTFNQGGTLSSPFHDSNEPFKHLLPDHCEAPGMPKKTSTSPSPQGKNNHGYMSDEKLDVRVESLLVQVDCIPCKYDAQGVQKVLSTLGYHVGEVVYLDSHLDTTRQICIVSMKDMDNVKQICSQRLVMFGEHECTVRPWLLKPENALHISNIKSEDELTQAVTALNTANAISPIYLANSPALIPSPGNPGTYETWIEFYRVDDLCRCSDSLKYGTILPKNPLMANFSIETLQKRARQIWKEKGHEKIDPRPRRMRKGWYSGTICSTNGSGGFISVAHDEFCDPLPFYNDHVVSQRNLRYLALDSDVRFRIGKISTTVIVCYDILCSSSRSPKKKLVVPRLSFEKLNKVDLPYEWLEKHGGFNWPSALSEELLPGTCITKRIRRRKTRLIFLDVDGVLNVWENERCRRQLMEEKVDLVVQLVKQVKAQIVLSSTWRGNTHLRQTLLNVLRFRGLRKKCFVGSTSLVDVKEEGGHTRARRKEIYSWLDLLEQRGIRNRRYVVVDDMHLFGSFQDFCYIDGDVGITREDVERIVDMFANRKRSH